MPDGTAMSGPPIDLKPCVHDSRRLDGWLDAMCMGCGAGGYWRDGEQITHPAVGFDAKAHPSGKTLIREEARTYAGDWPAEVRLRKTPKSSRVRLVTGPPPPGLEAYWEHETRVYVPAPQEVQSQPLQPIDDKVEAFRKRFFERTGDRLQRTAVVEGLRAALGGEAEEPVGEDFKVRNERRVAQAFVEAGLDRRIAIVKAHGIEQKPTENPREFTQRAFVALRDRGDLDLIATALDLPLLPEDEPERQPEDERESTEEGGDWTCPECGCFVGSHTLGCSRRGS